MGTVEVLPRTRKSKKTTAKPRTKKPTSSPTSHPSLVPSLSPSSNPSESPSGSPTAPKTIDKVVDKLLPDGVNDFVDPIAKWYYSDMRPTDLSGATAGFVNLLTEVSSSPNSGRNPVLKTGAPGSITSALRLHTRDVNNDKAEVGIKFYDGVANLGLFNGMLFKVMVTEGISSSTAFLKPKTLYSTT